ncbi:hypothetical protein HDU76_001657 [Blyttiomyces sp. JEL0837]|nr:hypothetical protein HDU76_001657 [Blyttiomyces sp. JEL0837]
MLYAGDWNKHLGVGATLLDNWVEERAVGEKILLERSNIAALSKMGHSDILTHAPHAEQRTLRTTNQDAYDALERRQINRVTVGRRRQLVENELMKRAISEVKEATVDRSAENWLSTAHHDYSSDVPVHNLGTSPPSADALQKFSSPITFWSDHASKGTGTVICSKRYEKTGEASKNTKFGRHAAFSTPIEDYHRGATKNH